MLLVSWYSKLEKTNINSVSRSHHYWIFFLPGGHNLPLGSFSFSRIYSLALESDTGYSQLRYFRFYTMALPLSAKISQNLEEWRARSETMSLIRQSAEQWLAKLFDACCDEIVHFQHKTFRKDSYGYGFWKNVDLLVSARCSVLIYAKTSLVSFSLFISI